ncbi:ArdC family protein [Bacillus cereus]|nr:ArdC family protein [Bacillus cereus]
MQNFITVEDTNKKLEKGLEEIFKNDRLQHLLKVMSQFKGYSTNNTILIIAQKPHATMVQGFNDWKKIGRSPKQYEKSIRILAPQKQKIKVEKVDPVTKEPMLDKNGKVQTETVERTVGYKMVSVFDVSQTVGKEIPKVRDFIKNSLSDNQSMDNSYKDFFKHVKETTPYDIKESVTDQGVGGYYNRNTNEIVISTNENKNTNDKFATLLHEYAHAKLHHKESEMKDLPRGHKEAQAESVAYVVSSNYGLERDDFSLGYIATWAKDLNLAKNAIREIQEVSRDIISTLDELQKDKILDFYQNNDKQYYEAVEFFEKDLGLKLSNKENLNTNQFELLNKQNNIILSARLEHSPKNDKFYLRTNKNMIIPLSEVHKQGDYHLLNKEITNNKLVEASQFKHVESLLEVHKISEGKYAVASMGGTDIVSKEYTNRKDAQNQLLRIAISQSLHKETVLKQYMKEQLNENLEEKVQDIRNDIDKRLNDIKIDTNFHVGQYLSYGSQKEILLSENSGNVIGWTLLKNKEIQTMDELVDYAFNKTKNLPRNNGLREEITNNVYVAEKEKSEDLKVINSKDGWYVGKLDKYNGVERVTEFYSSEKQAQNEFNSLKGLEDKPKEKEKEKEEELELER